MIDQSINDSGKYTIRSNEIASKNRTVNNVSRKLIYRMINPLDLIPSESIR